MNSKYDKVTMFLSVLVINNISNQNLQQCLCLISIPNFEKRDSSRLSVFAITLQAEYRFHAVANLTTYRPTTISIEDAYFRRVIIIYNSRTHDTSIVPNPQIVRLPCRYSSGQSFWLQIQRSRVRFPALPDFLSSSGSGTGSTQPREIN